METCFIEYLKNIDNIYHNISILFYDKNNFIFNIKEYFVYDNAPEWSKMLFNLFEKSIKEFKVAVRKFDKQYEKYNKLKGLLNNFDIVFLYNKINEPKIKRIIYFNKELLSNIPLRSPSFMEEILNCFDIDYRNSMIYNDGEIYFKNIEDAKDFFK